MTPEQHIAAAESSLVSAGDLYEQQFPNEAKFELLNAIGHALIALAVESGVPHQTTNTAGG